MFHWKDYSSYTVNTKEYRQKFVWFPRFVHSAIRPWKYVWNVHRVYWSMHARIVICFTIRVPAPTSVVPAKKDAPWRRTTQLISVLTGSRYTVPMARACVPQYAWWTFQRLFYADLCKYWCTGFQKMFFRTPDMTLYIFSSLFHENYES